MSKSISRAFHTARYCELLPPPPLPPPRRRCLLPPARRYLHDHHLRPRPPLGPGRRRQQQQQRPPPPSPPFAPERGFSTSAPWRAGVVRAKPSSSGKSPAQPSTSVYMAREKEKALREGRMTDDVGLLPGTFVMPTGRNRPGWWTGFGARLRLEKKRLRTRLGEIGNAFIYRWIYVRPRPRLHLGRIPGVAARLHETLNTHFAAGDLGPAEAQICSGLLGSLRGRVARRPAGGARLLWTLVRHVRRPRLVSYKAAVMPAHAGQVAGERHGIVQAVVRIHSVQSLVHVKRVVLREEAGGPRTREVVVDARGREFAVEEFEEARARGQADVVEKESVEYFVIQKNLRKGQEGPWMVWGSAEETTLAKLDHELDKTRGKK